MRADQRGAPQTWEDDACDDRATESNGSEAGRGRTLQVQRECCCLSRRDRRREGKAESQTTSGMTMKRLLLTVAAVLLAGCSASQLHHRDAYANPFYTKYLNASNPQDQQIQRALDDVRSNPPSAQFHNSLGQLLVQKEFPKDAEREFERSVDSDSHFYPAWYNLALVRASLGDIGGARRAFNRTVHYKPGHAAAPFQLGLLA